MTNRYAGEKGWPLSFDRPEIFGDRILKACKWTDLTSKPRAGKPWLNGMPRMIFLNDMGDTFTESLPVNWLDPYIEQMASSPHIWLILTKRPRRMRDFFNHVGYVPENFWLGTSVVDQRTADARIPALLQIPAGIRFLSCEPLLGPIDLTLALGGEDGTGFGGYGIRSAVGWAIAGGESGPNRRPMKLEWARDIRDECAFADVPFFMKQIDKVQPIPEDLMIREVPQVMKQGRLV
jgi:protein gp37